MTKKTLILGASENPERYAYKAAHSLTAHKHPIINVGIKKGEVAGEMIHTDRPIFSDIDTITLYIGAKNQPEWYDYILQIKPKRIVFNPNTENPELKALAEKQGIETIEACTLVMLSIGNY
jgi:predicted CoA-binding protein